MPVVIDQIKGPDAEKQFSALEDQAFVVAAPGHYLDDFPIWNPESAPPPGTVFRVGAFDGPKLVAAAGVRLAELRCPQATLTSALIGAVATAAEYRGRGLATQLVTTALQWATQRGAALALLWGSEHDLYAKLGFAPCGTQATIPLSSLTGMGAGPGAQRPVSSGWVPGILAALKGRRTGMVIRDDDRGWLSSHKNVQWFWTGSPERVSAYAALGRGIDLPHFVHEWGGETKELIGVLHGIRGLDPQARLLGSPALFAQHGFQYDPSTEERLGLARIIDAEAVFRATHGPGKFTAAWSEGKSGSVWKIGLTGSNGKTVSDSLGPLELSRLFFGPVTPGLGRPWSDYFPLPLWFWGLDAV